jgi:predicted DsbA family dithiol-disulfide isomerase
MELVYEQRALEQEGVQDIVDELGLDNKTFWNCTMTEGAWDEVTGDADEAEFFGVSATPTLFINGIRLTGVPIQSDFEKIIDAELAQ